MSDVNYLTSPTAQEGAGSSNNPFVVIGKDDKAAAAGSSSSSKGLTKKGRGILMSPLRKGRSFHDDAAATKNERRRRSVDGMTKAASFFSGRRQKSRNGIFSFLFPSTRDITPRSRAPIKLVREWESYESLRKNGTGFPAGIKTIRHVPETLMTEWEVMVERYRGPDLKPAVDRLSMTVDEKYPFVGPEVLYLGCKVKFVMSANGGGSGRGGGDEGGDDIEGEGDGRGGNSFARVPVGDVANVEAAVSPGGTTVSETERVFTVVWTPAQKLLDAMKTSIELIHQMQTVVESVLPSE